MILMTRGAEEMVSMRQRCFRVLVPHGHEIAGGPLGVSGTMVALTLIAVLIVGLVPSTQAAAYYNFGTVGIYLGASYLSVQAGQSTSTSISVDPSSDSQTLGCGMAKCPQVCTSDGAIEAGYTCFDVNGQCTCAGTDYAPYYPEVSASSSNSGVATAYVSGGTLVVTGNSAGTATITVSASLRQWTTNSTTIQVSVAPANSSGNASGGNASGGGSSSGNASGGGSSEGGSSSAGESTGAPTSSQPSSTTGIPQEATATDSRDDALNETVIETVAGTVYVVEKNSFLETRPVLEKIIGTQDQAIFWSGASSERPDYSWTFVGVDVVGNSPYLEFDPTITVSKLGTGNVSNIMKRATDGLVMKFAHEGELPGEAAIYVKVDGVFADGVELRLFLFDDETKRFIAVQEGIKVEGGYASFKTDHCSTWAFSTDDLARYEVEETNTPGAIAVDRQDVIAAEQSTNPALIAVAVALVAVAFSVVLVFVVRRARRMAAEDGSDGQLSTPPVPQDQVGEAGEPDADAEQ